MSPPFALPFGRVARIASLAALVSAFAPAASGLSLVPDPLALEPTTPIAAFRGEARPIAVTSGIPVGGVVSSGSVAPTDVTIVIEIELDAGAPEYALQLLVTHPSASATWTGAGTIAGSGTDSVGALLGAGAAFSWGSGLAPGETTDWLFLSLPALPLGEDFEVVLFGVPTGEQPSASGSFEVVPEPSTLALLLIGFVAFDRRLRT